MCSTVTNPGSNRSARRRKRRAPAGMSSFESEERDINHTDAHATATARAQPLHAERCRPRAPFALAGIGHDLKGTLPTTVIVRVARRRWPPALNGPGPDGVRALGWGSLKDRDLRPSSWRSGPLQTRCKRTAWHSATLDSHRRYEVATDAHVSGPARHGRHGATRTSTNFKTLQRPHGLCEPSASAADLGTYPSARDGEGVGNVGEGNS